MSHRAFVEACERAELFGLPKPDREEFVQSHKHLDEAEFEEIEIRTAEGTAMLDEQFDRTGAGLTEVNSILGSTQKKLNRLKNACGNFTNFFRMKLGPKDNMSYSSEPSYVGQSSDHDTQLKVEGPASSGTSPKVKVKEEVADINSAIEDLKEMKRKETFLGLNASKDVKSRMDSQLGKLDSLISKAEQAQCSMQYQNKQMRGMLK